MESPEEEREREPPYNGSRDEPPEWKPSGKAMLNVVFGLVGISRVGKFGWPGYCEVLGGFGEIDPWFAASSALLDGCHGAKVDKGVFAASSV